MVKKLSKVLAITLIVLMLLPFQAFAGTTGKLGSHPLKRKTSDHNLLSPRVKSQVSSLRAANIPSSADWTSLMPPPGDQGNEGSCVAWASGYALKSALEQRNFSWDDSTTSHQFSPSYIYNQINGGVDDGSSFYEALQLMENQGCDTLNDFPYTDGSYTTQPTTVQKQRAAIFKASSWQTITYSYPKLGSINLTAIKTALASAPVVAGTDVYWTTGWEKSGDISYSEVSGFTAGSHGICLVGYDDSHSTKDGNGAFKFINSWGTSWGHSGYGWISYKYAQNYFDEAESMQINTSETFGASGSVVSSGAGLADVTLTFTGTGAPSAVTTATSGSWSQTGFSVGKTYTVTPSKSGVTFAPASATFSVDNTPVNLSFTASGTPNQTSTITVTYQPTSVALGSSQNITWTYTGTPGDLKIDLIKGTTTVTSIASSVSAGSNGSGSYAWTVPTTLTAGSGYQVKITGSASSSCVGTSASFAIVKQSTSPTVTVTYQPNSVILGSSQNITWTYTGIPGDLKLDLIKGTTIVTSIASSVSAGSNGSGSYAWTVPTTLTAGSGYQVKITGSASSSCVGTSASFAIAKQATSPTITVTYQPTSVSLGSSQNITWTYTGTPGSLKIDLIKGTSAVTSIASSVSAGSNGSGSYAWTVPNTLTAGSSYQVKITSSTSSSCVGTSKTFTIVQATTASTITLTKPVKGSTVYAGTIVEFDWTYTGNPGTIATITLTPSGKTFATATLTTKMGSNGKGMVAARIPINMASGTYQIKISGTNISDYGTLVIAKAQQPGGNRQPFIWQ